MKDLLDRKPKTEYWKTPAHCECKSVANQFEVAFTLKYVLPEEVPMALFTPPVLCRALNLVVSEGYY